MATSNISLKNISGTTITKLTTLASKIAANSTTTSTIPALATIPSPGTSTKPISVSTAPTTSTTSTPAITPLTTTLLEFRPPMTTATTTATPSLTTTLLEFRSSMTTATHPIRQPPTETTLSLAAIFTRKSSTVPYPSQIPETTSLNIANTQSITPETLTSSTLSKETGNSSKRLTSYQKSNTGLVAGIVVAVLLLVTVVTGISLLYRRKKRLRSVQDTNAIATTTT